MTDQPVPLNISASLTYDDATAAIEWLGRAFGFEARLVVPSPDGGVRHSELSLGNGVIMVSSPRPDERRVGPQHLQGRSHGLAVHVDDVDAHYARAKAAGATIVDDLKDTDFGARGYMATDPEGHTWYFGSYAPGAYWDGATGAAD